MSDFLGFDPTMMQEVPQSAELPANIPEEEQAQLAKKFRELYDEYQSSVSQLHAKIDDWYDLYEAKRVEKKTFPWEGASNYSVPLVMASVDSLHARLVKAVFDVDPIWMTRARTPEGVQMAKKAQWYLDYWADQIDLPLKMDMPLHAALIEGTAVIKLDWVRDERQIPESGLQAYTPSAVVEYEGPEVYHVPLKDFVIIPSDSRSIDEAVYVGHRVRRTRQQLEAARDAGYYFNVDKLLALSENGEQERPNTRPVELVDSQGSNSLYPETQLYEIVEMYGLHDYGDGTLVPSVFTFSPEHEILLRLEPSPYQYGRPPYVEFCAYPRPNSFFGRSLADILESAQEELTALHNLRSDALTRIVAPVILKKHGSQWDEETNPLRPWGVIEVNSPDEIMELPLRDIPNGMFAHEQDILSFVERATGMSDYFMGRSAGPYHTATEVNRVTSEGLARVDVAISRVQYGMKKLAWFMWWLLYQYRPYWDYFYAENQHMSITKMEMRPSPNGLMPFEILPQGMLSDSSKSALRQQNLMLFQTLAPLLSQFYPDGVQHLAENVLYAFDVQDRAHVLGPSWNAMQQQIQQAMQQGYQQGVQDGTKQAKAQA